MFLCDDYAGRNSGPSRKDSLWGAFLFCVSVFLLVSSFLAMPEDSGFGYFLISAIPVIVIIISNYAIRYKIEANSGKSLFFFILVNIICIYGNAGAASFNLIYPATILLIWAQYCVIERQLFVAFLLLSCASLFFPPVLWIFPVSFIILTVIDDDPSRAAVKMAGGFFLPFVYITFYLFIRNAGIPSFYRGFLYGVTDVNFESLRWNIPDLFFIIAFLITGMHVVKDLFADIRKQNILNVRILVIEMVVLLHISVISLLFCNDYKTPASLMFSTPVSILFLQCPEKKSGLFIRSLEYLVLICTLTAVRAAHFA